MGTKISTHHIAIDSQGYVFLDSPDRPKRTMQRNTVFGNRFASGDRDYTDLSFWWYWAQTDWSGGMKNAKGWKDDAKFWYATNIDVWSDPGSFTIDSGLTLREAFTYAIGAAANGEVGGSTKSYIGTEENADSKVEIWSSTDEDTWASLKEFGAQTADCTKLFIRDGILWVLTSTTGGSGVEVVNHWNGSSWEDCSPDIETGASLDSPFQRSGASCVVGGDLYIAGSNFSGNYIAIVKTTLTAPTAVGDWDKVLDKNTDKEIVAMEEYGGDIYYLLEGSSAMELRRYDITNSVDSLIRNFKGVTSVRTTSFLDRYLFNFNGKLVITVPNKSVWEYDGSSVTRIYNVSEAKADVGEIAHGILGYGGLEWKDKIFWTNLIYDGTYFYPWSQQENDSTTAALIALFTDEGDDLFVTEDSTRDDLYEYRYLTIYRDGEDKNYLQFNEMEELSTVPKLGYAIDIIFDPLETGEEIEIKYSINGGASFTTLGNVNRTDDGGSVTRKTLFFGDDVVFEKIIFRAYLNGDGTSSPKFKDISMQYLPIPDYKYRWIFILDCGDDITTLDNKTKDTKKGVDLRHKLRASFLKRELVELEDIDYAETLMNDASPGKNDATITVDSADDFPEQGRLKIGDEEILYTGKTRITFTGCIRGYRGTNAADHANNDVVSNLYKVLITDYNESIPLSNEAKIGEFEVQIEMLEA